MTKQYKNLYFQLSAHAKQNEDLLPMQVSMQRQKKKKQYYITIMQIHKNRFVEEISGQQLQKTLHKISFLCKHLQETSGKFNHLN